MPPRGHVLLSCGGETRAFERVSLACGDCGEPMELSWSRANRCVYYRCAAGRTCRGSHGADQRTGLPLGTPGDAETREARRMAHVAFDKLWKAADGGPRPYMTRTGAYRWLRGLVGGSERDGHIGAMTREQCELVADRASALLTMLGGGT